MPVLYGAAIGPLISYIQLSVSCLQLKSRHLTQQRNGAVRFGSFQVVVARLLSPEFLFASIRHLPLTLRAGSTVPDTDPVTTALQAQTANLASEGWSHIGNDATHHYVLDAFAVGARHGRYLLTEQATSLIHIRLIAADAAAILPLPGHHAITSI